MNACAPRIFITITIPRKACGSMIKHLFTLFYFVVVVVVLFVFLFFSFFFCAALSGRDLEI